MNRRDFFRFSLTLGAMAALNGVPAHASWLPVRREGALPRGMIVIDAHSHPNQFYDLVDPTPDLSATLDDITTLGMQGSNFAAVGDYVTGPFPYFRVLEQIQYVNDLDNEGLVILINTHTDVLRVLHGKREIPGAVLSLEGVSPLGDSWKSIPGNLDILYASGVRMITVMHHRDNQFGEIMKREHPGKEGSGLTDLGRQTVKRMIELGMVIDGAHAHYATLHDMADIAVARNVPIIDSHTSLSPRAEPNGSRLRTWEEMEIIAGTGGLVCTWPLSWKDQTDESVGRFTILDWAQENYEIKERLGAEHIALGTDGGGQLPTMVEGYESILDLPKLIDAMHQVGFKRREIEDYMGKNFLRVLKRCLKN